MTPIGVIRYPGSKGRVSEKILDMFPDGLSLPLFMSSGALSYCEPFFGAGAVGFFVMDKMPVGSIVNIADIDMGIVALWSSVIDEPDELCELVMDYTPRVEDFYRMKADDGTTGRDRLQMGFEKIVLHRISWGGLGAMAGGPLGGKAQSNKTHDISCRWNPIRICREIWRANAIFGKHQVRLRCCDFASILKTCDSKTLVYADPPYYEAGPALYKHSFGEKDHERLKRCLMQSRSRWLLSYDDNEYIRQLYADCNIEEIALTSFYPSGVKKRKNNEVIVTPRKQGEKAQRAGAVQWSNT